MKNLVVTEVTKQAWNDERITLENEEMKVIMHLKNPSLHGEISVGEKTNLSFREKATVAKKTAPKKAKK